MTVKSYKEHSDHFRERLLERYGICLTEGEYDELVSYEYIHKHYLGISKKSRYKSVGLLNIRGIKTLVLYNTDIKTLMTVYPAEVFDDRDEMIFAFFPQYLRSFAKMIWDIITAEITRSYREVKGRMDDRDFVDWVYANCMFPKLVFMKIRGKKSIDFKYIIPAIWTVIRGEHANTRISIEHYNKEKAPKKGGGVVSPEQLGSQLEDSKK